MFASHYHFGCRACGLRFQYRVPRHEWVAPLRGVKCPGCGGRRTDRYFGWQRQIGRGRRFEPFYSESLGCLHPSERIPGQVYDADDRLLIQSPQHRQELMDCLGQCDLRDWKPENRKVPRGTRHRKGKRRTSCR